MKKFSEGGNGPAIKTMLHAPGVATAVALNLPLSVLVLRRAVAEQWVGRRARQALVPAALAFHLPGALGVMLLGRALGGSG